MNPNPNDIIAALLNIASAAFRVNHGSHHTGMMLDEVNADDLEALAARLDQLDKLPQPEGALPLTPSAKAIHYMRPFLEGQKLDPAGFYDVNLGVPHDERFKEPTDAKINEITMDKLGKWPSFEAQSWACKVVHAVVDSMKPNDGWVLAKETAVDMEDGSKELGYTLVQGFPVFTDRGDAITTLGKLNLPIGWVVMPIVQLIPGYVTPEPDPDMYTKMLATTADQANKVIGDANLLESLRQMCGYIENGGGELVTIFQDDATREWTLSVGFESKFGAPRRRYTSSSFHQVIRVAAEGEIEKEVCKFCGFAVEFPCETPPPDVCSTAINASHRQPISWPQLMVVTADASHLTKGMKAAETSARQAARNVMKALLVEVKDTCGILVAKRLIREACPEDLSAKMDSIGDDQVANVTLKCRDVLADHKRAKADETPTPAVEATRELPREVTVYDHFDVPDDPTTEDAQRTLAAMERYVATGELPTDQVQGQGGEFDGGGASGDYQ